MRKRQLFPTWDHVRTSRVGFGTLYIPHSLKNSRQRESGLEDEVLDYPTIGLRGERRRRSKRKEGWHVLDRREACLLHAADIEFACQRVLDKGGQKAAREVAHI